MKSQPQREPGFDVERTVAASKLVGVRPDGAAARAGLSEGQSYTDWKLVTHGERKAFEFTIADATGQRQVTVVPDEVQIELPAFVPADCH